MSYRRFFAILFIVSLFIFLFFKFYLKTIQSPVDSVHSKTTQMQQKPMLPSVAIEPELTGDDDFILIASLISSILSFFGFLISSFYSHRGHVREEELFDLKRERERLEMEKIRAEINALRGES
jgi:uncharacterized protein YjcR